jgi:hypothetical protein
LIWGADFVRDEVRVLLPVSNEVTQATSYDDIQDSLPIDGVAEEGPGSYDDDFDVALAPGKGKSKCVPASDPTMNPRTATKKVTSTCWDSGCPDITTSMGQMGTCDHMWSISWGTSWYP